MTPALLPFSPLSHLLALGLLGWLAWRLARVAPERELRGARIAVVAVLLGWLAASSAIAHAGLYLEGPVRLQVGILAPLVLVGGLAAASSRVRELLAAFVDRVPLAALTSVHAVRILAIGTIAKWLMGALPGAFIVPVGIPDFLIGLTALPMARRVAPDLARRRRLFVTWNLIGAGVYLIAPPLIQLTLPAEVLSFPMAIVPTFIAPLLLALHIAALLKVRGAIRG